MRVLVLGRTGMLGHMMVKVLGKHFNVPFGTVREQRNACGTYREHAPQIRGRSRADRALERVDATRFHTVRRAVDYAEPDVVVNCIGITPHRKELQNPALTIGVNALFPHYLASYCRVREIRLIHISTDCVFSGRRVRGYSEKDEPDPTDLYGRSKLLGEVMEPGCITLRTSIVGPEQETHRGLLAWFLAQPDDSPVQGYRKTVFSGLTTLALADTVRQLIVDHPDLRGLYHVGGPPISKYDLLCLIQEAYGSTTPIIAVDQPVSNRTLSSTRFRRATGINQKSWALMVEELAAC